MIGQPALPWMRANFRHLYADIFWFGVQSGSVLAFQSIYATRIGANSLEISLLTAMPAVINLLCSLPAARWLENRRVIPATFWTGLVHRAGYLLFVPLPWLLPPRWQVWALIALTLFISIPGTVLAIGFNSLFAEVTPAEQLADVVGRRNALMAFSMTTTSLLCGQVLDRVPFPLNYTLVFGLGSLGALLSIYHIGQVRSNDQHPERVVKRTGNTTLEKAPSLLRFDLLRGPFGMFLAAYLLFYTFQYTGIPIFPIYNVRVLHLTDGAISLGSALFYTATFVISLRLGAMSVRLGHRGILVLGALLFSSYPLILGFARNANLYWVASMIGGGVWGMVSAGLINRLMHQAPEIDRHGYMALHNLALNLGILLGSSAAVMLGSFIELREALWVVAGLRLLAGVALWIWS